MPEAWLIANLLASRLPCWYTSSILLEACPMISCTILLSSFLSPSSDARECLKVFQPTRLVILACTAAGRMWSARADSGQYGRLPFVYGDANTQSSSWLYRVRSLHSSKACASSGDMGRLLRDASVLRLVWCFLTTPWRRRNSWFFGSQFDHFKPRTSDRRRPDAAATITITLIA